MKKIIKNLAIFSVIFISFISIIFATDWINVINDAWNYNIANKRWASGETLNSEDFSAIVEQVSKNTDTNVLLMMMTMMKEEIAELKNKIVPSGAVMAFSENICPDGWSPADGTNGNIDLRGEFIRGWDNGRSVDSGRSLKSWQKGTAMAADSGNDAVHGLTEGSNNPAINRQLIGLDLLDQTQYEGVNQIYTSAIAMYNQRSFNTSGWGGGVVRPRNVALLYCVKN